MKYCSSCQHADDGGIIGNEPVCAISGATNWRGHTCGQWVQDERSFEARYPEYPYADTNMSGRLLAREMREATLSGGSLVPVQEGVVAIYGPEGKQLLPGEYLP